MANPPDPRMLTALFRMLEPRLRLPGLGLLRQRGGRAELVQATPALSRLWPSPGPVAAPPATGGAVEPARYGLPPGFAALWPLAPPFALIAHDGRARRLTPALGAALDDAALLLEPLLGAAAPCPAPPSAPPGHGPCRRAILPRAAAHRVIEAALGAARAAEAPAPVLLMIGLDRFRFVNEALGLAAGDALLAVVAARLERALGPDDRLSRLEGDRFLVLARRDARTADRLAARLLEVIRQPIAFAGRRLELRASIGVIAPGGAVIPAPTLLLRADSAMRRAKIEGRGRIAVHEPALDEATLEASQLELDLASAPVTGQMRLDYQPFVDLRDGALAGAEALMRWRHPVRGDIGPATFIPLAESTGLILPLGLWALRSACRAALRWPPDALLAVNISALQFHQRGFITEVGRTLAETGFPAERLELEITETALMRDDPETHGQLDALIASGIRIALDDFGTGYSALAYLARLPHHRIKLDKSFVGDLANPATAELIRAIIAQARANGVAVTAEGVERPEQVEQVRAMGFTHAQGYATGLPGPEPFPEPTRLSRQRPF
ncbi:putative bifunctional diguanylate cyclase/phosphodiesterase [Amaricoccus solimangrovi]|uniref:Bifunctional diguanylate cyclase/phosphodiesterase n=1 Tax=Amaricoccus solimangrovi TaxID=2589815 RepID=A0A501WWC6_9RHOB|nr:bifunctional diguanylate cyclase/phosphodiesterase [Amaricoccus solimangrovi]TPE53032.1 bifunctional diguanylate cyclase/phosphodiesterase [Amaricoccus solimangrovi]